MHSDEQFCDIGDNIVIVCTLGNTTVPGLYLCSDSAVFVEICDSEMFDLSQGGR